MAGNCQESDSEQSRLGVLFATRVEREAGSDPDRQIEHCYLLALSRPPTAEERSIGFEILQRGDALTEYCHVILALNEFIYIQ